MHNGRCETAARAEDSPELPVGSGVFRAVVLLTLLMPAWLFLPPAAAEGAQQLRTGFHHPSSASFQPDLKQLNSYSHQTAEQPRVAEERVLQPHRRENPVRLHTIRRGETLSSIARLYGVEPATLAFWNDLSNPNHIETGDRLRVLTVERTMRNDSAVLRAETVNTKNRAVLPLASRDGGEPLPSFRWPLRGVLTSFFGMRDGQFHFGLDIAAPYDSEVVAVAAGLVQYTGMQRGYGRMLTIYHGNGWKSLYAHNSRLLVGEGDWVLAGQPITLVGTSGNATGPHLHLEIMHHGKKLNPLLHLPGQW